ncbi:DUF2203 domain-containing protein [Fictibacillus sp. Mic-4]|uniref:DUF2203 domain-containing protein n=1 Tax=Fictibacillus TaxID=1329200 RepID=UPI00047D5A6D|nr:DUF2203 domain-containing protein [Fictibacillus gelatini]
MKYFALEEANQLLPVITKELEALQKLQKAFNSFVDELERMQNSTNPPTEEFFMIESKLELLEMEAQSYIHKIQSFGVQLRDIQFGLVDFPAIINNEEVLLRWRQGDPSITKYHRIHNGLISEKSLKN